ncbi:MAG: hypothetical protein JW928_09410 [Candidatus Aureabacteria bacterium]|nr:hypothetical protein [Candidatus Auribacterota bacterium]
MIISFDTELGWGAVENGLWRDRQQRGVYIRTRSVVAELLSLMKDINAPSTWAFVGRMIETEKGISGRSELKIPSRLLYEALKSADSHTFEGNDIFKQVADAGMGHEIAWHSYYHVCFDSPLIDREYMKLDMEKAKSIGKTYGIEFCSFIFPQNIEGYLDLISQHGFTSCRVRPKARLSVWGRLGKTLDFLFYAPPMSYNMGEVGGLKKFSGSMFFNPGRKRKKWITLYKRRAIKGIKKAVQRAECFHLWCHPFNFAEVPELFEAFQYILKLASEERDKGRLSILTMAQYRQLFK